MKRKKKKNGAILKWKANLFTKVDREREEIEERDKGSLRAEGEGVVDDLFRAEEMALKEERADIRVDTPRMAERREPTRAKRSIEDMVGGQQRNGSGREREMNKREVMEEEREREMERERERVRNHTKKNK